MSGRPIRAKYLCHLKNSEVEPKFQKYNGRVVVRGSYSARVPRSSMAEVHREFVHHNLEDEVDGQKEGQGVWCSHSPSAVNDLNATDAIIFFLTIAE